MIHFVKDIRKDLGNDKLPFIIATSGMGGKGGAVHVPQLKAAAQIDNCYAVDTIRFRGARVKQADLALVQQRHHLLQDRLLLRQGHDRRSRREKALRRHRGQRRSRQTPSRHHQKVIIPFF